MLKCVDGIISLSLIKIRMHLNKSNNGLWQLENVSDEIELSFQPFVLL